MSNSDIVRTAEVIAATCLATDLAMGFPFEHGLEGTLLTMRLCGVLDVDSDVASQTYYGSLLMHVGCQVNAAERSHIFAGSLTETGWHRIFGSPFDAAAGSLAAIPRPGDPWPRRMAQYATGVPKAVTSLRPYFAAMCEASEMLAERMGVPASIHGLFPLVTERWDGWGNLRRAKGDQIPLAIRIVHVGRDAAYQRLMGDDEYVVKTIQARGGHAFDPEITEAFVANWSSILGGSEPAESVWDQVLSIEPKPWLTLDESEIDRALAAIGAFSDLASPYLTGHASGVGDLAAAAARICGWDEREIRQIRRAGYLHDLGRVSVNPRIWENAGRLSADEWEHVRLHPYHTDRILSRSPVLAPLASTAGNHHERLDGSGYHRGLNAASQPPLARLLAAADAFRAKTEPRAYREALDSSMAAVLLVEKAKEGRLDSEMVAAVIEAAGLQAPQVERPAGLTEREVEVVGLLTKGMQTKQIARALDISVKTADRHIQNAYRKMGVSSRAAATLFAVENGMIK
jgi:HD-GYP domain-containing protein (c-di-GMP phosphodiesterase class II)